MVDAMPNLSKVRTKQVRVSATRLFSVSFHYFRQSLFLARRSFCGTLLKVEQDQLILLKKAGKAAKPVFTHGRGKIILE
jgi:hypothetical protein